jgi:hypothetical protein
MEVRWRETPKIRATSHSCNTASAVMNRVCLSSLMESHGVPGTVALSIRAAMALCAI